MTWEQGRGGSGQNVQRQGSDRGKRLTKDKWIGLGD